MEFLVLLFCIQLSRGFLLTKQICFDADGIGCFDNASPYGSILPESPSQIKIEFLLYTRVNTHAPQIVTKQPLSIQQSHFNGSKKTKFIIHGYQDDGRGPWLEKMATAILTREDANVFAVNWAKGADNVNYLQAAANTRVVGALIAQFITALHTAAHAQYGNFHLIGHSLGSHIAGYAGERIHGLGRITGLDPAGPAFENKDPKVRLDPTDAIFVDALHTNGDSLHELGFGLEKPVATADFYPNGGDKQPGCPHELGKHLFNLITLKIEALADGIACSHMRVLDFYIESINSPCKFQAYPCANKADYNAGRCNTCGQGCAKMGYHADEGHPRGTYFLNTKSNAPYCIN